MLAENDMDDDSEEDSDELPMMMDEEESEEPMKESSLDSILASLKPEQLQALKAKIESMV